MLSRADNLCRLFCFDIPERLILGDGTRGVSVGFEDRGVFLALDGVKIVPEHQFGVKMPNLIRKPVAVACFKG